MHERCFRDRIRAILSTLTLGDFPLWRSGQPPASDCPPPPRSATIRRLPYLLWARGYGSSDGSALQFMVYIISLCVRAWTPKQGLSLALAGVQDGAQVGPYQTALCGGEPETLYTHRDDALLYIAYVMLILAAPTPADRWHCSLWPFSDPVIRAL